MSGLLTVSGFWISLSGEGKRWMGDGQPWSRASRFAKRTVFNKEKLLRFAASRLDAIEGKAKNSKRVLFSRYAKRATLIGIRNLLRIGCECCCTRLQHKYTKAKNVLGRPRSFGLKLWDFSSSLNEKNTNSRKEFWRLKFYAIVLCVRNLLRLDYECGCMMLQ